MKLNIVQLFRKFLSKKADDECRSEIVEDFHPVFKDREEAAFVLLMESVCEISRETKLSRRQVFCNLMTEEGLDYNLRNDVTKFFWKHGLGAEQVAEMTDEFVAQTKNAKDEPRGL